MLVSILMIPLILMKTITKVSFFYPLCPTFLSFFFLSSLAIYRETNSDTSQKEFLKA